MMTKNYEVPFLMSIETTHGVSERDGFHLGTDERVARKLCEERYHGRVNFGMPVVTVALLDARWRMIDCYDGDCWSSDR